MKMNKFKTILLASSVAASVGFIFTPASHANDCEQIHDQLRVCFDVVGSLTIDDYNPRLGDSEPTIVTLKAAKEPQTEYSGYSWKGQFGMYYKYNSHSGGTSRAYVDCVNRVVSYGIKQDQKGGLIPHYIDPFTGDPYEFASVNDPVFDALVGYFCDGSYITTTPELPATEPTYFPVPSIPNPSPTKPTLRETLSDTPFQWKQ